MRFPIVVMLTLLLVSVGTVPVLAQGSACRFVLGFGALREMVGASKVGSCLEDEHFNLENGNAEQRTSGGLLVWRKVDNFTAFTDGGTTWVNGPNGLQSRPNAERFSWERDPLQTASPTGARATPTTGTSGTATPAPTRSTSTVVIVPTPAARSTPAPRFTPTATHAVNESGACSPSYPDFCIPAGPPDVNCDSPVLNGRKGFTVLPPDPHRLDQDGNGVACESSRR
jgi:hypothetical protein